MLTEVLLPSEENIEKAAKILQSGGLIGLPTETVYGLGCDARNAKACLSVFAAKGRPADNPLIVHISNLSMLSDIVKEVPQKAKILMDAFWPGPLTIIMPKCDKIPNEATANLDTVAVRYPVHPVAMTIIEKAGIPVAAPSANLSGRPSTTTAEHVYRDLNGKIPLIVDGGACQVGLESTVVDATKEHIVLLRPGGITREMLEEVLGEPVTLGKGVMEPLKDGEKALSPGLLHKHYAPKAEVKVILGDENKRVAYIREEAKKNMKPCVLCMEQNRQNFDGIPVLSAGNTPEEYAHNLFAALRKADDFGFTQVYAEGLDLSGMGLAVMNRVERAAGFHVINV